MKKPLAICALALLAVALYAQDAPGAPAGAGIAGEVSMLDVQKYSSYFLNSNGSNKLATQYTLAVSDYDYYDKVATLGKDNTLVDTPLEIALLSYSAGLIDARPVQAAEMLPANDPRTAGLKLGAAVLKELTELRFLDPRNAAAIARYEGMLQFISDKNGVSRAEIDTYYRQGISGLIAGAVDEEFGKISFLLTTNMSKSYNAVLTHNPKTKEYKLSYEDAKNITKELSATSLNALRDEMRMSSADFDETGIQDVLYHASIIPAVVIAEAGSTDAIIGTTKNILTAFYTNPTAAAFNDVKALSRTYGDNRLNFPKDDFCQELVVSFSDVLFFLNQTIAQNVFRSYTSTTAISPNVKRGLETVAQRRRGAQR